MTSVNYASSSCELSNPHKTSSKCIHNSTVHDEALTNCVLNLFMDSRENRCVLLLKSVRAVQAMACGNHSLQSYFLQKEFFGELIVFRHLNVNFTIFFNIILSDLSKLSLSFKTKP